MHLRRNIFMAVLGLSAYAMGQTTLSGSIQHDMLLPEDDSRIGTEKYQHDVLSNTYAELNLMNPLIDAGARLEYMEHPLPGFENDFKGWGIPYYYIKGKLQDVELTLGSFYEQFGSGLIFRSYEERALGVDNALTGARLKTTPFKGTHVKAIIGKQRRYWKLSHAWIGGGDMEVDINQWCEWLGRKDLMLTIGASFINKHGDEDELVMADASHSLNMPDDVSAYDLRVRLQKKDLILSLEYAGKGQDPSFDNGYIYRKGYAAMLSASYSRRGMSMLIQAKRSDNMSFRSSRSMNGVSSFINHLPAFTMEHTYALAALYPYATQSEGEWAYQATWGYLFKRHTLLGGRYGTKLSVNFSHVHALDASPRQTAVAVDVTAGGRGTDGYGSSFWKWGRQMYYQDLNVAIEKKLSGKFKLNMMYMNQFYNKTAIEGHGGMVHSDIFVTDGKWSVSKKLTIRAEAQYLCTADDEGDWMAGLVEASLNPHWSFSLSDMYNSGVSDVHYYTGSVAWHHKGHRLGAGYGRTRAGFNCSGGVCRYVPASRGLSLNYNYSF